VVTIRALSMWYFLAMLNGSLPLCRAAGARYPCYALNTIHTKANVKFNCVLLACVRVCMQRITLFLGSQPEGGLRLPSGEGMLHRMGDTENIYNGHNGYYK
jgi:hypothetical protein